MPITSVSALDGPGPGEDTDVLATASRILDLVDDLSAAADRGVDDEALGRLLLEATVDADTLAPYVFWAPGRYTRNLLYRSERFELMALCWEAGVASPIHDHAGQRCFMKAVAGAFEVEDFVRIEGGRAPGPARLTSLGIRRLVAGELDSLDASRDIHRVAPAGGRAMSLHVYARPLDRAMVWDLASGRCRYAYLRDDAIRADAFAHRAIA